MKKIQFKNNLKTEMPDSVSDGLSSELESDIINEILSNNEMNVETNDTLPLKDEFKITVKEVVSISDIDHPTMPPPIDYELPNNQRVFTKKEVVISHMPYLGTIIDKNMTNFGARKNLADFPVVVWQDTEKTSLLGVIVISEPGFLDSISGFLIEKGFTGPFNVVPYTNGLSAEIKLSAAKAIAAEKDLYLNKSSATMALGFLLNSLV
jgi:hypothetical protein